jgi:hypothetical protein
LFSLFQSNHWIEKFVMTNKRWNLPHNPPLYDDFHFKLVLTDIIKEMIETIDLYYPSSDWRGKNFDYHLHFSNAYHWFFPNKRVWGAVHPYRNYHAVSKVCFFFLFFLFLKGLATISVVLDI